MGWWCLSLTPAWRVYLFPFQFVLDGDLAWMGDAVPTCSQCFVEVLVLAGVSVLGGCLKQLLGACKPEPVTGEGAPAKVPGAKCLCPVLYMAT